MKQGKLTVDVVITIDDQSLTLEEFATAWRTAKQRVKVLERASSMSQQGLAEVHLRNEARLAKRITELETQFAESRERERKMMAVIDEVNDIRPHDCGLIPHRVRKLANAFLTPIKASAEEPCRSK